MSKRQEQQALDKAVSGAAVRGDVPITNLQHDGVIIVLPDEMSREAAERAMSQASSAMLGYDQPVEEKPFGEDVSDSEEGE